MKRLLIWGTGGVGKKFQKKYQKIFYQYYDIVGYIDNDKEKQGSVFCNKTIYSPEQICNLEWDMILLCTISKTYQEEMLDFLQKMGIERRKIACYTNCEGIGLMRDFFLEKYYNSADPEIKEILQYIEEHELTVFNMKLEQSKERYKVYCDSAGEDPYIWIDNKRMYYPKEFLDINVTPFLYDIYTEQSDNSPHLYVPKGICLKKNSVILDAGAREGNFSLKYVEDCKKIYIVECEKIWCRVLEKTFAPYKNKVNICNVFLGKENNENVQNIDSLVKEPLDMIKMDIEGAEIEALKGAGSVLCESNAFCAISAYHNGTDENSIKKILNEYGYKTSVSQGYMLFGWDDNFYKSLDIRRGIVYGNK